MPDCSFLGTLEAVLGHAEAVRAPPLHEKMHAPVCTLLLSFRPRCGGRKLNLSARPCTTGHLQQCKFKVRFSSLPLSSLGLPQQQASVG